MVRKGSRYFLFVKDYENGTRMRLGKIRGSLSQEVDPSLLKGHRLKRYYKTLVKVVFPTTKLKTRSIFSLYSM